MEGWRSAEGPKLEFGLRAEPGGAASEDGLRARGPVQLRIEAEDQRSGVWSLQVQTAAGEILEGDFEREGAYASWRSALDLSLEPEGMLQLRIEAEDGLNNSSEEFWSIQIDQSPPEIQTQLNTDGGAIHENWIRGGVQLEISAEDALSPLGSLQVTGEGLPAGSLEGGRWSCSLEAEGSGGLTLEIRAEDDLGNQIEELWRLQIDNRPPGLEISLRGTGEGRVQGHRISGLISLRLQGVDEGVGLAGLSIMALDASGEVHELMSSDEAQIDFELNTGQLLDGLFSLEFLAWDHLGNQERRSVELEVDNTGLQVELSVLATEEGGVDGQRVRGIVELGLPNTGEERQVEFFVGESLLLAHPRVGRWISTLDTTGFPDGALMVHAQILDTLGNSSEAGLSLEVDNTPPELEFSITADIGGLLFENWAKGPVQLQVEALDEAGIARIEVLRDGEVLEGLEEEGSWGLSLNSLEFEGQELRFEIRAWDRVGNLSFRAESLISDNTPPDLLGQSASSTEEGHVQGEEISGRVHLRLTLRDLGSDLQHVNVAVSGRALEGTLRDNQPWIWEGDLNSRLYPDGPLELQVLGSDRLGNSNEWSWTLIVDNTLEEVGVELRPIDGMVYSNEEGYRGAGRLRIVVREPAGPPLERVVLEEGEESTQALRDGEGIWSIPLDTEGQADGLREFIIQATDHLNNQLEVPLRLSVDNTGPSINAETQVIEGAIEGSWWRGRIRLNLNAEDLSSPIGEFQVETPEWMEEGRLSAEGTWFLEQETAGHDGRLSIQATVSDDLGNSSSQSFEFQIDNTPPLPNWRLGGNFVEAHYGGAGWIASGEATLSFLAQDEGVGQLHYRLKQDQRSIYEGDSAGEAVIDTLLIHSTANLVLEVEDALGNQSSLSRRLIPDNDISLSDFNFNEIDEGIFVEQDARKLISGHFMAGGYSVSDIAGIVRHHIRLDDSDESLTGDHLFSGEHYIFYSVLYDSQLLLDGAHYLEAELIDRVNNSGFSAPLEFVVDNSAPEIHIFADGEEHERFSTNQEQVEISIQMEDPHLDSFLISFRDDQINDHFQEEGGLWRGILNVEGG